MKTLASHRIPTLTPARSNADGTQDRSGFTLTELLVIITVVALMAVMILPAMARTDAKSHGATCLNNLKQVMSAVHLYAADNGEWLPPNPDYQSEYPAWIKGDMKSDQDATNIVYLIDPRCSRLAAYTGKNPHLYRCPQDPSTTRSDPKIPRVRSISMNLAVGTKPEPYNTKSAVDGSWLAPGNVASSGPYRTYAKLSSMTLPSPANLFILIEEHPRSINDGCFNVRCSVAQWIDYPATFHNRACAVAFGDGHVEMHKWLDQPAWIKYADTGLYTAAGRAADGPDWAWLSHRTSALLKDGPQ